MDAKICAVCSPLLVSKSVLDSSSKQGLFSKEVWGKFDILKGKFLPYVKLGAVLGSQEFKLRRDKSLKKL